jgi:hypothetical protein
MNIFTCWKPLYIMYSFERLRCGVAFLSRFDLETPIFGKSIQKAELLDFIIDTHTNLLQYVEKDKLFYR